MTDVYRITCTWTGFTGAPGYSKFSFQNLTDGPSIQSAAQSVHDFWNSLNTFLKTSWTISIGSTVQLFDMALGHLTGEVTVPNPPPAIPGTALTTAIYAGGVGAHVNWTTGLIFNGHRVRGRTYLVPFVGVSDTDGTLTSAAVNAIGSAAGALIAGQSGKFVVWSRRFDTSNPPQQVGGSLSPVQAYVVPDKTGILKSRRD